MRAQEFITEERLDEVDWSKLKKGAAAGALALSTLGSPNVSDAAPVKPAVTQTAPVKASIGKWTRSVTSDEMDGKKSVAYSIHSTNSVDLGFPYGRVDLELDIFPDQNSIMIASKGQFYNGGSNNIRIKVDDGPAQQVQYSEINGYKDSIASIGNARTIQQISQSKKLKIEVSFYKYGTVVFNFDSAGLDKVIQPVDIPKTAVEKDREDALAALQGATTDSTTSNTSSNISNKSIDLSTKKIKQHINTNLTGTGDLGVTFKISVMSSGEVLGRPKLVKSSGKASIDDAVERAILESQPLPVNSQGDIELKF